MTKNKKAFSLLELSIVLMIIAGLIAGAIIASKAVTDNTKSNITKERLELLYKALGQFVVKNGRLPCPAVITTLKTAATYGEEAATPGTCTGASTFQYFQDTINSSGSGVQDSNTLGIMTYGMIPVKALGLSNDLAEDEFGSKIAYMTGIRLTIAANLNTAPTFFQDNALDNFSTLVNKILTAWDTSTVLLDVHPDGINKTSDNASIFALISYGPNKFGAYNANSGTQNTASSNANERNNYADFPSIPYNIIYSSSSLSDGLFDDIVLFKSAKEFISDFNAMFLVPCRDAALSTDTAFFGQTVTCVTDQTINSSIKCGPYGQWSGIPNCPPLMLTSTTSYSYTVPAGYSQVKVWAIGGGGGGGPSTVNPCGGGYSGGAGGVSFQQFAVSVGQSITYSIGSAGSPGGVGGDTSVTINATTIIGRGGGGGSSSVGGSGGSFTGGTGYSGGNGTAGGGAIGGMVTNTANGAPSSSISTDISGLIGVLQQRGEATGQGGICGSSAIGFGSGGANCPISTIGRNGRYGGGGGGASCYENSFTNGGVGGAGVVILQFF